MLLSEATYMQDADQHIRSSLGFDISTVYLWLSQLRTMTCQPALFFFFFQRWKSYFWLRDSEINLVTEGPHRHGHTCCVHLSALVSFSIWLLDKKIHAHKHTRQHGDPHYYGPFMCLCKRTGQQQAKYSVFTCSNSSALNTGRQRYIWHGSPSLSFYCWNTYFHLFFLLPLMVLQYVDAFSVHSPSGRLWSPAAAWASKVLKRFAISPSSPQIPSSSSNRKVQRLTVGFRCLLFYCSVVLYASPLLLYPCLCY